MRPMDLAREDMTASRRLKSGMEAAELARLMVLGG